MYRVPNEMTELIRNGTQDPSLKWYGNQKVRVRVGDILAAHSAVQQTLMGRRKRLREAIRNRLADFGWGEVSPNVYQLS